MSGALHVWELQCKVGRRKKREDTHEQGEGHPPPALGEGVWILCRRHQGGWRLRTGVGGGGEEEAEGRAGEVRQEEKASLEALGSDSVNWSLD